MFKVLKKVKDAAVNICKKGKKVICEGVAFVKDTFRSTDFYPEIEVDYKGLPVWELLDIMYTI